MMSHPKSIYDTISLASDMKELDLIEKDAEASNNEQPSSKRRKTFTPPPVVERLPDSPVPLPLMKGTDRGLANRGNFKRKTEDKQAGDERAKRINEGTDEEFTIPDFNYQYVTDRIAEHVISCIENQTNPTSPAIPAEVLKGWIAEGVNLTMDPLILNIQEYLHEQSSRMEQHYGRKWDNSTPSATHMSYIS